MQCLCECPDNHVGCEGCCLTIMFYVNILCVLIFVVDLNKILSLLCTHLVHSKIPLLALLVLITQTEMFVVLFSIQDVCFDNVVEDLFFNARHVL